MQHGCPCCTFRIIKASEALPYRRIYEHPPLSRVLRPSPIEGKGDRLRWMRCQHRHRTLFSLSDAFDSDLTAKLSLALRAARVKIRCPSEAAVRAGNLCGGVPR